MNDTPMFITVSTNNSWGVGKLITHEKGWWVDLKRSGLRLEDAQDLRDAWNERGAETRP